MPPLPHRIKFGLWLPLILLAGFVVITPQLANHDPLKPNSGDELASSSDEYWLGTDYLGRDVFSRLMVGGQRTLSAAFIATGIAITGGLLLGGLLIIAPAPLRWLLSIFLDALLAFPSILTALVILTALEPSLWTLALALGIAAIPLYAQVAADALRGTLSEPFIEGARSIGASPFYILRRHIIPTALPTLAAFGSVIFSWSLIYQAALTFLGLGGDISQPDWGTMLAQGYRTIRETPLLVIAPGGMLMICVLLANWFADTIGRSPSR
ncbi:MAG: ABC transporter permease [Anaerolineae bacterium]|nr:ABC transporter permease [Anaerolineae bacterium]